MTTPFDNLCLVAGLTICCMTEGVPTLTEAQRSALLDGSVNALAMRGWQVASRTPTQVVMMLPASKPNHVLHAILTIFTCLLWGIVWALLPSRPERRLTVMVDEHGQSWSLGFGASAWEPFVA